MRTSVCCFSGYRPEKMPHGYQENSRLFAELQMDLCQAIRRAHAQGCLHFLSGMSRGFDLWAAQAVLAVRGEGLPISQICTHAGNCFGKHDTDIYSHRQARFSVSFRNTRRNVIQFATAFS